MMRAFVLIQKEARGEPLAVALRSIPGIDMSDDLTGPFDAIAVAEAPTMRDVLDSIIPQIRELPGVTHAIPAQIVGSVAPSLPGVPAAA
jgi:hypothetical protein